MHGYALYMLLAMQQPQSAKPVDPPAATESWSTASGYVWDGKRWFRPDHGKPQYPARPIGIGPEGLWNDGVPYDSDVSRDFQRWEHEAATQSETLTPRTVMSDANGTTLNVGDMVLVPAEIIALSEGSDSYCTVSLKTILGRRPDNATEIIAPINTGVVVKVGDKVSKCDMKIVSELIADMQHRASAPQSAH